MLCSAKPPRMSHEHNRLINVARSLGGKILLRNDRFIARSHGSSGQVNHPVSERVQIQCRFFFCRFTRQTQRRRRYPSVRYPLAEGCCTGESFAVLLFQHRLS